VRGRSAATKANACNYEYIRKTRKNWRDMGIAKSTFSDNLKIIEKVLRGL